VQVQSYPGFLYPVDGLNIQTGILLNLDPLDVGQCTHASCYIFLTMPNISCIMCTCSWKLDRGVQISSKPGNVTITRKYYRWL